MRVIEYENNIQIHLVMAQRKGQTGNPNGRPAGSPNKVTSELKEWITDLINDNKDQFTSDLQEVDPDKRLAILERLFQYVLPKQQSISIEAQLQAEYRELRVLLENAPEDAIDKITERILNLKNQSNENEN